ncbi:hypothetical protein ACH5RR_033664 [Cinchona calisaya]|uniref:Transposase MuDR plant domain-containing protein n=1 Tax=Cinchona calisaya TaxID=153742 RepID=A0ABD2YE32_9GENT
MFGLFRDQPHICLYVGNLVNIGPQNQNVGQQEVDAAELENLNVGTHVIEHNQVDSQIPKFEDPVIEQNENINVREEDQVINSSDSGSDGSYIPNSNASTEANSDFSFFLYGDTLSDGCDFNDEGGVTNVFENNIDLGEYTTYAELISDDYRKFLEARRQGKIVENDNPIGDHDILEAAFNSSDDENREPFREFNEERDMMNPEIEIGLIFSTVHVYRKALRMYSILKGFELKFKKNDSNKVIAICHRKCGWKIYASYYRGTKAFQIKSIKGTPHRCPWSFKNMSANSRWLANNFSKELCDDPKWDLKGFKRPVRKRFKLHSSKYQIYRAKNHALAAIHGKHKEQFNRLIDYCSTIMSDVVGYMKNSLEFLEFAFPPREVVDMCSDELKKIGADAQITGGNKEFIGRTVFEQAEQIRHAMDIAELEQKLNAEVKKCQDVQAFSSVDLKRLKEDLTRDWVELCDDPKWDLKGFKRTVRKRFKLHSSKYHIYRAKNHALAAIHEKHKEQFNRLRDYCSTIMMKNPGSASYVVSEVVALNANPIFKRMFIMFGAQKNGFVQGCRPVIGLDACHLKDKFGGHLMHVVGRDGNNQMYPLAMAWVESECKDSWSWFLETLTRHIGS